MIIYLYGPDSYRRQEKLNWYAGKFKEKHTALTIEHFDLMEKGEMSRVRDFATAQSLFDDFKFGVLHNIAEVEPKDIDGILRASLNSKSLTLVISVEKELLKPYKVFAEKEVIRHEFESVKPAEFISFVKLEAAKRGFKLPDAALETLMRNYHDNTWGLITELDKLALGASAEPFLGEQNFFSLATILQSEGPASYKLPALERLLIDNDSAAIFNFVASRANADLKTKMADWDVAIKSGKTEYDEALFALALRE